MRGYCSHCAQLVPIRQGPLNPRGDGRVRLYYPLPHRDAHGRECVGIHEDAGKAEFPECAAPPGRAEATPPDRRRIKIDTSDPETKAVWDTAVKAAEEVASWPKWKRGES
jgi:hypothetical protein